MSRYETRPSPVTGYIWVTWDTQANWFVYGSMDHTDVQAYTDRLNAPEPPVSVTPPEE